ncbi:zinc metalloprotease [Halocalculus aciditolerans]|uniref:metalloprotease n=1 Tax=Halocalculus aciditolerans TaxID=1383812 RepID=UPI0016691AB8|nr:metalloprotease [Halocalculus aciditolerans]
MNVTRTELRDLLVAWVALGVAFAFLQLRLDPTELVTVFTVPGFYRLLAVTMLTAGVGFLLHELAHKVVAVHYGQYAEFRADYGMLLLAVASGLAGFLFAAPGAVHHRGRLTDRQGGLIALAGPVTNLVLAGGFYALSLAGGVVAAVAGYGVTINLLLAGFNMLPYGPLDGRKVRAWSTAVWAATAVPCVGLAVYVLFF